MIQLELKPKKMVETSAANPAQTDRARAPTQFSAYTFVRRNSFAEKLSNAIFEKLNEQVPYLKLKILGLFLFALTIILFLTVYCY